jgi:hypothetical protein
MRIKTRDHYRFDISTDKPLDLSGKPAKKEETEEKGAGTNAVNIECRF